MEVDSKKLFKNIKTFKNVANINILKCYKILFNIIGILKNIGSNLIILVLLFHLICIILFYMIFHKKIINIIKAIIFGIKNIRLLKERKKDKITKEAKLKDKKDVETIKNADKKNIISKINFRNASLKQKKKIKRKQKNNNLPIKKKINPISINITNVNQFNKKNIIIINKESKKENIINNRNKVKQLETNIKNGDSSLKVLNKENKEKIRKVKSIMKYNDEEMNKLEYIFAIKYDKRTFCQYYISLLKAKHNLIFSFFNKDDYNSNIIKINFFFIGFVIELTVNSLFFSDNTMHKIYDDEGTYNIEYRLPKSIYSFLISKVLSEFLKFLALSEKGILVFKQNKSAENIEQRAARLKNKIKIKFAIYFILTTIILLFCWYYISIFCAVYQNTQLLLISDGLISFGISLINPFGYYLVPGLFRIPSLKKKRPYLYLISKIVQLI